MTTALRGGGKYDPEVRAAMAATQADAVLLIVLSGDRGSGFSLAINDARLSPEEVLSEAPALLRALADRIDSHREGRN